LNHVGRRSVGAILLSGSSGNAKVLVYIEQILPGDRAGELHDGIVRTRNDLKHMATHRRHLVMVDVKAEQFGYAPHRGHIVAVHVVDAVLQLQREEQNGGRTQQIGNGLLQLVRGFHHEPITHNDGCLVILHPLGWVLGDAIGNERIGVRNGIQRHEQLHGHHKHLLEVGIGHVGWPFSSLGSAKKK
jgi:hypothetical protein